MQSLGEGGRGPAAVSDGSAVGREPRSLALILLLLIVPFIVATDYAPEQTCAIDMGSNSFRRIVGAFANGRYLQTNIERRTLNVGDDLTRFGRISDQKLVEIEKALAGFKMFCDAEGVTKTVAIGTAAFRDAPNGRAVVGIAARLGVPMEIATEKRESELAYLVGSLGQDGYAVIDNGSRSIELVSQENGVTRYAVFNLGYRVAYDAFFAAALDPQAAVIAFRSRLMQEASGAFFMKHKKRLIGVEFGEMVDVLFPSADPVEGRVFTLQALRQRLQEITSSGANAFTGVKTRENIDRALPRLVVAVVLMEELGYSRFELTERELGAGLIIEAGMEQKR